MAFNGDGQRLVGDDGFVKKAVQGATIDGDGLAALPEGALYLITTVAAVTGFPAPAGAGTALVPGNIIEVKTGIVITPETGDTVIALTESDACDVSSWAMALSKEEIDITTFCDLIKTYATGKADLSGTMNGIFTTGITDATDGILRQFMDIVQQDGGISADVFLQQEIINLGKFYLNDNTAKADEMYILAPFQNYTVDIGGEMGSPQSFASTFRLAKLSMTDDNAVTVAIIPAFYRIGDGV